MSTGWTAFLIGLGGCAVRSCCGWISIATQRLDAWDVAEAFELDDETRDFLSTPDEQAVFNDHGRYIHITTYAPRDDDEGELHAVECVVGENWVITAHDRPISVLEEFAARVSGSGDTGSLDGPGFLAALLEWVLSSYTAAFERIEQRLEDFENRTSCRRSVPGTAVPGTRSNVRSGRRRPRRRD